MYRILLIHPTYHRIVLLYYLAEYFIKTIYNVLNLIYNYYMSCFHTVRYTVYDNQTRIFN